VLAACLPVRNLFGQLRPIASVMVLVACAARSQPALAGAPNEVPPAHDPWTLLPADPAAHLELDARFLEFDAACDAAFRVTVVNTGSTDVFVNFGTLLNGGRRQIPDGVGVLLDADNRPSIQFPWRPYNVGGTVHQFLVPLRAGSTHSVRVTLADFLRAMPPAGEPSRIEPGPSRRLAFVLNSREVPSCDKTLGIVRPPLWVGELVSSRVDVPACR
jgi:hypothetical protein